MRWAWALPVAIVLWLLVRRWLAAPLAPYDPLEKRGTQVIYEERTEETDQL